MAKTKLTNLIPHRIGNRRTRNDVLQVLSFPGLSVDNADSTPSTTAGSGVSQQVAGLSGSLSRQAASQRSYLNQLIAAAPTSYGRTSTSSSSSGGIGGIGGLGSSLLGSVFGLGGLVQGLFGLFGGSGSSTPTPLVPFNVPPQINYAGGVSGGGQNGAPVDYGQNGLARPVGSNGASQQAPGSNVHIQVNAMDSQSFLDHSEEIAQAVRQALLNSSSLADVISEL